MKYLDIVYTFLVGLLLIFPGLFAYGFYWIQTSLPRAIDLPRIPVQPNLNSTMVPGLTNAQSQTKPQEKNPAIEHAADWARFTTVLGSNQ